MRLLPLAAHTHPWGVLIVAGVFVSAVIAFAAIPGSLVALPALAASGLALVLLAYKGCSQSHHAVRRLQRERRATQQVSNLHQATIEALALAIEAKDSASYAHLRNVQQLAGALAGAAGMAAAERHAVETAALLHDIGMLAVPPHIVAKTGPLSPEELQKIQIHARIGADIIRHVPFPMPVAPLIESHHERWDGLGYPAGLAGEAIPLGARIIALVDRFGALMADRPHRRAKSREEALAMIQADAGAGFDPALVAFFVDKLPGFEAEYGAMFAPPAAAEPDSSPRNPETSAADAGGDPPVLEHIARAHREFYELFEMSRALVSLSVTDAMALMVSRLSELVPTSCCALFVEEDGRLRCRYASGLDADLVRPVTLSSGEGFVGRVHASRRVDVTGEPFADWLLPPGRNPILRSALACPLHVEGGSIGVLWVAHVQGDAFEDDHARIIDAVARQAAGVLDNAMRFERARRESMTDVLTGLLNSRGLTAQAGALLVRAHRDGEPLAVLMLDVDDLKTINDTWGHAVGDVVLCEVARTLRSMMRPSDLSARWAGDEFVAVLAGCSDADADRRRLDLQATLATRPIGVAPGESWFVRVSVGSAAFPDQGRTLETLMEAADARMYREKQAHKRTPRVAVPLRVAT